jgi:hypothetical protein
MLKKERAENDIRGMRRMFNKAWANNRGGRKRKSACLLTSPTAFPGIRLFSLLMGLSKQIYKESEKEIYVSKHTKML